MSIPQLSTKCRLHGVSIFLSASVPTPERRDEYARIPEAPLRIEEAVLCVARAIFMEGGTLVFGAHPSISPLVARVVDDYYLPAPAEKNDSRTDDQNQWRNPRVIIFQSRVWEEYWAEATKRLELNHELVKVEWIDAQAGETVNPAIKNRPQAQKSLEKMRVAMIGNTSPVAMIAIGGMQGVLNEASIFNKIYPQRLIYTLATTGGAAALLAKQSYGDRVHVFDHGAADLVSKFWEDQEQLETRKQWGRKGESGGEEEQEFYVPYAFITQRLVNKIIEDTSREQKI